MILYDVVFNIVPVAQERARVRVMVPKGKKPFAIVYDPPKSKKFKADLQQLIKDMHYQGKWDTVIDQPMIMSCKIYIKRPKSVKISTRYHPEVKPDLSNYIKGIEDAMNGLVYKDDAKIIGYKDCFKAYTEDEPCIEVTLHSV
jgi:Holliday junction resolvase RusA-like endonuclease